MSCIATEVNKVREDVHEYNHRNKLVQVTWSRLPVSGNCLGWQHLCIKQKYHFIVHMSHGSLILRQSKVSRSHSLRNWLLACIMIFITVDITIWIFQMSLLDSSQMEIDDSQQGKFLFKQEKIPYSLSQKWNQMTKWRPLILPNMWPSSVLGVPIWWRTERKTN